MARPLTAAAVEKLRPDPTRRREIRDGAAQGLYLTIHPSGAKSWACRYRRPDGRTAKLVLGPVDLSGKESGSDPVVGMPLSLRAARQVAATAIRDRAMGRDPGAERQAEKYRRRADVEEMATSTFAAVSRDFIEEHARPRTRNWRETARILGWNYPKDGGEPTMTKGGLASRWASKLTAQVDGHEIYGIVDECRRHGIPGMGRHNDGLSDSRGRVVARTLSKMFAWAVQHRRVATNPCAGMYVPPPPAARDRVLTAAEIKRLWQTSDKLGHPFDAIVKLLLLTGARLNEVAQLVRGELSDDLAVWTLAAKRTKNGRPHVVPLPAMARAILADVRPIAGERGYLFTTTGRTPVSGFSRVKARLDRLMTDIPAWRLHDLRRTAATGMAELGVAPHIVEACLNHVSGAKAGVAGTYNRAAYADEKRAAMERWVAHIEGIVAGRPSNVVSLRGP